MKYVGKHNAFDELLIGPVLFTFPDAASFYQLTLPVDDGTSGQVLATDGNGVLSWVANGVAVPNALTIGTGVDLASGNTSWDGSAAETLNLDLTEVISTDGANRLLTSDGDGTLTAEANATFDGSTLTLSTSKISQTYSADGGTDMAYLLSASSIQQDNSILIGYASTLTRGGNVNAGQTTDIKGIYMTIDDYATGNVGDSKLYGLHQLMSFSGTGGNTEGYGIYTQLMGGDVGSNIGLYQKINDGGFDVKFVSSANTADFFSIATKAAGETVMSTTDSSSHAADLTFNIDGDIFLDNDGLGLTKITSDGVEIENSATSASSALIIDNNDIDQIALEIEAANTIENIVEITAHSLSSNNIMLMDMNTTWTGACSTVGLYHDLDKFGVKGNTTISTYVGIKSDIYDQVTNDAGATITYTGIENNLTNANSTGTLTQYGLKQTLTGVNANYTTGIWQKVDDGATDLKFVSSADTGDYFSISTTTHGATTIATLDDDAHAADLTFNVDGFTKFTSPDTTGGGVEIENASASGVPALLIDNNDDDEIALSIDATNTTADVIGVRADALTTGSAINLDINDTLTTSSTKSLIKLDYDKTGDTAAAQQSYPTGLELSMTDSASANVGIVQMKGIDLNMDHSSAAGVASSIGIDIDMNGGDATSGIFVEAATKGLDMTINDSTGTELYFRSSANTFDSFQLNTGTNAETTLTTVDWDAALAHFNVVADGNIVLDAAGDIELNADSGIINFKDASASLARISTAGLSFENNTGAGIIFDGATDNAHLTTLNVVDPTADRDINLPDSSGTVALTSDIPDETVSTGTFLLKQTKVTMDATACNNLYSSPTTLVAAQGADTIIMPVDVVILVDYNSSQSVNCDLIVGYNGTTAYTYAIRYVRRFMYGVSTDMTMHLVPYLGNAANSLTGGVDVPLTMSTSAAITAGSITSITAYTSYYVIDNS